MEAARTQRTERERPAQRPWQEPKQPEPETTDPGKKHLDAGQGDPSARFKQAQKEFI